jgi:hypothetical protein
VDQSALRLNSVCSAKQVVGHAREGLGLVIPKPSANAEPTDFALQS